MILPGAYIGVRIKILIGIIILHFVLVHPATVVKLTHLICHRIPAHHLVILAICSGLFMSLLQVGAVG